MMGRRIELSIHFEAGHSPAAHVTGRIGYPKLDYFNPVLQIVWYRIGLKVPEDEALEENDKGDVDDRQNSHPLEKRHANSRCDRFG
jgi:hypothetical protein